MNISKKSRTELKNYFKTNDKPTEAQFGELIDGMLNQQDDGIAKPSATEPLSIAAVGDLQKIIDFYEDFTKAKPAWSVQLNPRDSSNTARVGFCVADGQSGSSQLFIDKVNGNIGIGTVSPRAKLDIALSREGNNHPITIKGLYLTGDFNDDSGGIELRNSNASKGIGFGTTTIYAAGSDTNQVLQLQPKGTSPLRVLGKANISADATTPGVKAVEDKMQSGSLIIGSFNTAYGGNTGWSGNSNLAGLLLQTQNNTEIVVNHYNKRLASFMQYVGGSNSNGTDSNIIIGRNMGATNNTSENYGTTNVTIPGNLTIGGVLYSPNKAYFLRVQDDGNLVISNGTTGWDLINFLKRIVWDTGYGPFPAPFNGNR